VLDHVGHLAPVDAAGLIVVGEVEEHWVAAETPFDSAQGELRRKGRRMERDAC
jgi:hypothetical protein